jgi:predicted secreted protein
MSISLLRRLLMKEAVKDTAGSSGIMSINKNIADKVEQQVTEIYKRCYETRCRFRYTIS